MRFAACAIALLPTMAFAVGSGSDEAPKPSETVENCDEGLVFDIATQTCMTAEESTNDDTAMMNDVRSLSHAGRHDDALAILALMPDQADDLVLTYLGFNHRKAGNIELGMAFYQQALAVNPDNILARSYMGQALAERDNMYAAMTQLSEIQQRGGRGTWAERALLTAISTGKGYSY